MLDTCRVTFLNTINDVHILVYFASAKSATFHHSFDMWTRQKKFTKYVYLLILVNSSLKKSDHYKLYILFVD